MYIYSRRRRTRSRRRPRGRGNARLPWAPTATEPIAVQRHGERPSHRVGMGAWLHVGAWLWGGVCRLVLHGSEVRHWDAELRAQRILFVLPAGLPSLDDINSSLPIGRYQLLSPHWTVSTPLSPLDDIKATYPGIG